jgi:hypothetical protein
MNIGVAIGSIGLLAILLFQEYFFGSKDIDDSQGFPHSRNRKRR